MSVVFEHPFRKLMSVCKTILHEKFLTEKK